MKRIKTSWWIIGVAAVLLAAAVLALQSTGGKMAQPLAEADQAAPAESGAPQSASSGAAASSAASAPSTPEVDQIPEKFADMAPPSTAAQDRARAGAEAQERAAQERAQAEVMMQERAAHNEQMAENAKSGNAKQQLDETLRGETKQGNGAMDQLMASRDQTGASAAPGGAYEGGAGGGGVGIGGLVAPPLLMPPEPKPIPKPIEPAPAPPAVAVRPSKLVKAPPRGVPPRAGVNGLIGVGPPAKEIALPDFPWPPPTPSERMDVPPAKLSAGLGANPTLADIGNRLADALNAADYSEFSYFRAPGGFALVARLEHIQQDGAPVKESRFLLPNTDPSGFSLASYLKQLFFAPQGFYRLIVFVVTDQPVIAKGPAPSVAAAEAWLRQGADRLPPIFATMPFTADHQVSALIYEFRKSGSTDVSTLNPGLLDARTHLVKAGLYAKLTGAR